MPSDSEQRQHWAAEIRFFKALLGAVAVIGASLVGVGVWVGGIESRVAMVESKGEGLAQRIEAVQARTRATENTAARVDQRLLNMEQAQERQDEKLEKILDILNGRYRGDARPFRDQN